MRSANPHYIKGARQVQKLGKTTIVKNLGPHMKRLMIGVPTLGVVRIEWDVHRRGQIIPINWQSGEVTANHLPDTVGMGYHTADAQNLCLERAVLDKYEWCFRGDTLVETVDGAKAIRDVQVGELVKTHTGEFHRVLKVMSRPLKQREDMIWVRTPHGVTKTTPRHPFWTRRDGEMRWVAAEELRAGDPVFYPAGPQKEDWLAYSSDGREKGAKKYGTMIGDLRVDRRLARLLGLFLAEGHASPDHFAFTISNEELYLQEFIVSACREFFGREARIIRPGWSTQIRLSIRPIARRLREWFGHRAKNKRVPDFVFGWNLENRLEFLKGYLDGDGAYGIGCAFSSASRDLVDGIAQLARSCGLSVSDTKQVRTDYERTNAPRGLTGNQVRYDARLPKKSLSKLLDMIEAVPNPGGWCIPLVSVERHSLGWATTVYNLEVECDNTYIADAQIVHNCVLWEDDVLAPFDSMLRLAVHMEKMRAPIISGLYFSKSEPTWPLVFRGRGSGAFLDFEVGERRDPKTKKLLYDGLVWADGVPTGFLAIHRSIFEWVWKHSSDYQLPDGRKIKQVFRFPRESWFDPEQDRYFAQMGTSDLAFCDRLMKENVFAKTGWKDLAKKKYPFLVDTNLYAQQIDLQGKLYPNNCNEILAPKRGDFAGSFLAGRQLKKRRAG